MNIKKIKEHNPQSFLDDLKRVRDLRLIKKVGYISTSLEKHLVIKIVLLLATYTITLSY